uniref:Uncharacterized protein n=1 Tax=Anopheles farauti TaxID=69004 RepID=A0A182Q5A1_9DIPT
MIASTVTISTVWARAYSSVAFKVRARSRAAGPRAACTVAFGKPDSVTYAFSFQLSSLPIVESAVGATNQEPPAPTETATSSVITPYRTVSPSSTEKFTSFPISEKDTGFRNFHSRSRYMLTSLHSVGGRLRHPVPATNAVTMHPSAPADGLRNRGGTFKTKLKDLIPSFRRPFAPSASFLPYGVNNNNNNDDEMARRFARPNGNLPKQNTPQPWQIEQVVREDGDGGNLGHGRHQGELHDEAKQSPEGSVVQTEPGQQHYVDEGHLAQKHLQPLSAQPTLAYRTPQNSIPSMSGSPVSETRMPQACAPTNRNTIRINPPVGWASSAGRTVYAMAHRNPNTISNANGCDVMGQLRSSAGHLKRDGKVTSPEAIRTGCHSPSVTGPPPVSGSAPSFGFCCLPNVMAKSIDGIGRVWVALPRSTVGAFLALVGAFAESSSAATSSSTDVM